MTTTTKNHENGLLLLAAIHNTEMEIDILRFLLTVEYTGQMNKRYATHLNKLSADKFGTRVIENWGLNGEDKTVNLVTFYFARGAYSQEYELKFYYPSKTVRRDWDSNDYVLGDHTESETIWHVESHEQLVSRIPNMLELRRERVEALSANFENLAALEAEHAELLKRIEAFNDKIAYPISNNLRIRR